MLTPPSEADHATPSFFRIKRAQSPSPRGVSVTSVVHACWPKVEGGASSTLIRELVDAFLADR